MASINLPIRYLNIRCLEARRAKMRRSNVPSKCQNSQTVVEGGGGPCAKVRRYKVVTWKHSHSVRQLSCTERNHRPIGGARVRTGGTD
jgi:hypothetical protein